MKEYSQYDIAIYIAENICISLQRHLYPEVNLITQVHQEFCNLFNKLSFSVWTGTDAYTFSFNAYTIIYVGKCIKGEDTHTIFPPENIHESLKVWQKILKEGLDEIFAGKGVEIAFVPVLLSEEETPNMHRCDLMIGTEPHEFIFSYGKEELKAISLSDLNKYYKTFNLPEVIRINIARPMLSDEQISTLYPNTPNESYVIEEKPDLISRMLMYIMIAQEQGLLGLLSDVKWEKDPLTCTLLESAIDGKESPALMEMAKKEIALLEFKEGDKPLYLKNIKIVLTAIKLLHAGKGLKNAADILADL